MVGFNCITYSTVLRSADTFCDDFHPFTMKMFENLLYFQTNIRNEELYIENEHVDFRF